MVITTTTLDTATRPFAAGTVCTARAASARGSMLPTIHEQETHMDQEVRVR